MSSISISRNHWRYWNPFRKVVGSHQNKEIHMSTEPPQRPRDFFEPLAGDESGTFELLLTRDCVAALENQLPATKVNDDFVFHSHLRFFAALYYFLGGSNIATELSRKMERSPKPETITRWLNGQSAPAPSVRADALGAAASLLKHIEVQRRAGASLWDIARLKH